ncbi:MAG: hypothetical protein J6B77_07825, partial [Clostridia bacterium]|nr:hypothetical protein [Clostridia bacterium]
PPPLPDAMLEILPVNDPHEQEALAARFRIPYLRTTQGYTAQNNGKPIALCQFRISQKAVTLCSVGITPSEDVTEREHILSALLLGTLAFAMQNDVQNVRCTKEFPEDARRLLAKWQVFSDEN